MSSWLFVPTQQDGTEKPRLHNTLEPGQLISHTSRFMHTKRRQERLKDLKESRVRFPCVEPLLKEVDASEVTSSAQDIPTASKQKSDNANTLQRRSRTTRSTSPTSVLGYGQSDPFSSLAIEITPEANEIISFFREYSILAFYNTKWESSKAAVVTMHWQSVVRALHDHGSGLGFLARNAQILNIVSKNQRIQIAAFRYSAASSSILRRRLEQTPELTTTDQWHISMLWGTEILFRNLEAALVHGKMLRRIVEDQAAKGTLDLVAFRHIVYYDIQLCTMLMVRSMFDYFKWVPDQYRELAAPATSHMKYSKDSLDAAVTDLDPCIDKITLLPIFQERRRHMKEHSFWLRRAFDEIHPLLYAWLAVCHHICHGQLITHALDSIEKAQVSSREERASLLNQAILALTALYETRAVGGQLVIRGVEVFEARRAILEKLSLALTMADSLGADDRKPYRNATLWALYVGSRGSSTLGDEGAQYEWLGYEFERLRTEMGLTTWVETQKVLQGFLHHGDIVPLDIETPLG
ncbi:hypothetical protein B0A52_03018 [Exophiala mesophila]|uniref:Transcription factor domain-containing protein n=1 Tax=Exophiala mesophila TaxID=212818 RepID=A0A438NC92_EXOME|nr:hypothetical protein B0A52_03018 [Exophiala mesophila]